MQWGYSNLTIDFNFLNGIMHFILVMYLKIWSWLLNTSLGFMYLKFSAGVETLEPLLNGTGDQSFNTTISNITLSYIETISKSTLMVTVVGIVSTIGVVSILLKYGYVIFKTYFLNMGNEASLPTADYLKRIVISLILVVLIPVVSINLFAFSSYLGMAATVPLNEEVTVDKMIQIQYIYDHEKYGINPTTYCYIEEAQNTFGGKGFQALNNYRFPQVLREDGVNEGEKELFDRYCKGELQNKEYDYSSLAYNGIWYKQQPAMVAQTLLDSTEEWPVKILPIIYEEKNTNQGATPGKMDINMSEILRSCAIGIFSLGVMLRFAQLLANLISSILMGWYYIQDFITYSNSPAIGQYIKKLFSIFLTLFYVLILYSVFIKYIASTETFDILHIVITIVLWRAYQSGTTVIQDLILPSRPLGMAGKTRATLGG